MTGIILDRELLDDLRQDRKESGADRWDEVWEGVYVMAAMPNNEHQSIANTLLFTMELIIGQTGRGRVFPGVNISDQSVRWKRNYRCPDIAVFLPGNTADDRGTHWYGGPDLAVEIASPDEDPYAKLDFYADVETREVLIVVRAPWRIELFQLKDRRLVKAGTSLLTASGPGEPILSNVTPFSWRLVPGGERPQIETTCTETGQVWHA